MMNPTKTNPVKATKTNPVKTTPAKGITVVANAKTIASDTQWQTEDDARTLERAEEIKKDPKRLQAATVLMEAKMENIKSFVAMKTKKS